MADYYVDFENGNDFFAGDTFTLPSAAKNMYLFIGGALNGATVTAPSGFTEKVEYTPLATMYLAEKEEYGLTTSVDAVLSAVTTYKHAFLLTLNAQSSTPISFINYSGIHETDTSVECTPPASIADNDILIGLVLARQDSGLATITYPDGWTMIAERALQGNKEKLGLCWKRASSESGNYTFSHNGTGTTVRTTVMIAAYRGCKTTGNPYEAYSNTAYTTNNTTLRAAALTNNAISGPKKGIIASGLLPGDEVKVAKSTEVDVGDATWTDDSETITLATARTQTIDLCSSGWQAAANITLAHDASTFSTAHGNSLVLTPAAAFTTGKMAWKTLPETLDLSSYSKISLNMFSTSTVGGNIFRIDLCSDNDGNTPISSITINYGLQGRSRTVFNSSDVSLGSGINSVAIVALSDPGTAVYCFNDIFATNDLLLNSVVTKNNNLNEWYCVGYVDGTTIKIAKSPFNLFTGTTETVNTKIIMPHITSYSATYVVSYSLVSAGEQNNPVVYRGGYNTVSGLVDGITFYGGLHTTLHIPILISADYISTYNFGFCDVSFGAGVNAETVDNSTIENCFSTKCGDGFRLATASALKNCTSTNCTNALSGISTIVNSTVENFKSYGCNNGIASVLIRGCVFKNCVFDGTVLSYTIGNAYNIGMSDVYFYNCYFDKKVGNFDYTTDNYFNSVVVFKNCEFAVANPYGLSGYNQCYTLLDCLVEGSTRNQIWYVDKGRINREDTIRHTESGFSWKISPTKDAVSMNYPIGLKVASVAHSPGATPETIRVSAWVYRTNTGITARLICPSYQLDGIEEDVEDYATGAAEVWEQLSIDVVPTQEGTFDVEFQCWGGTTYSAYIDDVTIEKI